MNSKFIIESLNKMYPNAKCELIYHHDYELLISTVLSAQSTDKRVNEVTKILYQKYDLNGLKNASINELEEIIKPVGTYHKKSVFIKEIATHLINECNGIVPPDRKYLETLPGVGRKTTNVVFANLFNEPSFAVDTHVTRISIRLGIAEPTDDVLTIEHKLNDFFPKNKWNKLNDQMIFFGRYKCKAKNPNCVDCPFKKICKKI
jgi:endonuclease III